MGIEINRRDAAYTIITRLEEALRFYISEKLCTIHPNFVLGIPAGIIEKIKDRDSECCLENCIESLEQTDFTDLKEIILFQNAYKTYFPSAVLPKKQFIEYYDELYELRCKIAHSKPFNSIDLDKLTELSESISSELEGHNTNFKKHLELLRKDPSKAEILNTPFLFNSDTCKNHTPNNLPVPDYEYEGGFVGRTKDREQLKKLILGDTHRVITITGAGGVGKTSLATKVVDEIIQKEKNKFDYIIWLSAKEKKLSYLGIEDVEPTVKDYEEFLNIILEVTGLHDDNETLKEKENNVNYILDLCNRILIVVDNLETITDEKIKNFILDCHHKLKILITSRKGLGQVNRIYGQKFTKLIEIVMRQKKNFLKH